jgi:hypothetical protein
MTKFLVIAALLIGGLGLAAAQDQVPPGNKSEAATPAPPAQQNAPPDKVAPGRLPSPNAVPPDDKPESNSPALKMDSGADKKSPAAKKMRRWNQTPRALPEVALLRSKIEDRLLVGGTWCPNPFR